MKVVIDTDELVRLSRAAHQAAQAIADANSQLAVAWARTPQVRPELVRIGTKGAQTGGRLLALAANYERSNVELYLERAAVLTAEGVDVVLVVPSALWSAFTDAVEQELATQSAALAAGMDHLAETALNEPLRVLLDPGSAVAESAAVAVGSYLGAHGVERLTVDLPGGGSLSVSRTGSYSLTVPEYGVELTADPETGAYRRVVLGIGHGITADGTISLVAEPTVSVGPLKITMGTELSYNPVTKVVGSEVTAAGGIAGILAGGLRAGSTADLDDGTGTRTAGYSVDVGGVAYTDDAVLGTDGSYARDTSLTVALPGGAVSASHDTHEEMTAEGDVLRSTTDAVGAVGYAVERTVASEVRADGGTLARVDVTVTTPLVEAQRTETTAADPAAATTTTSTTTSVRSDELHLGDVTVDRSTPDAFEVQDTSTTERQEDGTTTETTERDQPGESRL